MKEEELRKYNTIFNDIWNHFKKYSSPDHGESFHQRTITINIFPCCHLRVVAYLIWMAAGQKERILPWIQRR